MTVNEFLPLFEVKLENFDGPIDLLLHLVKMQELPIEKLSLAQVADQYLACIDNFSDLDLEIAGEYLVIAATLLSIKSSILLNKPVELVIDDEGRVVDPHDELLRKLKEAAVFKNSAAELADMNLLGMDVFQGPSRLKDVDGLTVSLKPHDPILLGKAFRKLLKKAGDSFSYVVSYEPVSIVDRMRSILTILDKEEGPVKFENLIPEPMTKGLLIASFISLLELCKRQIISLKQDEADEEIYVVLASRDFDKLALNSEFDTSITANA
jgi:segregation and condensation protein A